MSESLKIRIGKKLKELKKQNPVVEEVKCVSPDDQQIIAVISAAIASSMNTSTYNLNIRSFRRLPNWGNAARQESIDRFI